MSAYIVDHGHIDALLSYGMQHEARYVITNAIVRITPDSVTEIGRILLDENERSVRHRYPDDTDDELPGSIGQNAANYTFRRWPAPLAALTILKACACYDYQACETDDYRQSVAYQIIDAIRSCAIHQLPGFSDSPGWSMCR